MKGLGTVIKFTMKEMVSRKSYIISVLIILLLIVIGFNVPNIMNAIKGENIDVEKVLVYDETGKIKNVIDQYKEIIKETNGFELEFAEEEYDLEKVTQALKDEKYKSAIHLKQGENQVDLEYIVESLGMNTKFISIEEIFRDLNTAANLEELDLPSEVVSKISEPVVMNITQTTVETSDATMVVVMMLSLVLFMAIYFCAFQVSSSITVEKTSKIIETLVTSTEPKVIVLGKTIGIGLVGLLQMILVGITAFISYKLFLPTTTIGTFDISTINPLFFVVTIIYFILGYSLFALIYALVGATVSKPEEVNSANTPVSIITVLGFYLAYFSMMNPASSLNIVASILPISSPFSMPMQLINGTVGLKEVLISIGLLIITIVIVAKIAIKIYSSAILNNNGKMSLKEMINTYKDKNN